MASNIGENRVAAWLTAIGFTVAGFVAAPDPLHGDVRLPSLFGEHMVFQQGQTIRIWGWADPGEKVEVSLGENRATVFAGDGRWKAALKPMPAGGPHVVKIEGKNSLTLNDVMVGEVWLCSGQSNMQWAVRSSNDADLEIGTANFPDIRLLSVPQVGTQEPQDDFRGQWQRCSPETVPDFSAVGYFFGRRLHQTLGVPVGLIDNAWGGSSAEAWVPRQLLAAEERYGPLLQRWEETEKNWPNEEAKYEERLRAWQATAKKAREAGEKPPARPRQPRNPLKGQHRPGNLYCGVLHPLIGYGIRGAIWYQGESNAGRAYQYRHLFPLMIETWREAWEQGDFPFYWVQLADFMAEKPEPAESAWAELREAQTMTLSKLPNTGEAVIIDIGEGRDIHPRNKQDAADRLARWALARDYGRPIAYRSPTYKSAESTGSKMVITFDHVGAGLYSFDVREPVGFAIAGADHKFVWAQAKIVGRDRVEVWSDDVPTPVAVRYGWADNPVCNLRSREGLPATPFRTDDWPGVTIKNQR